jgi:hypothetical protein
VSFLVRYGQSFSAFGSSAGQHSSAVSSLHPGAEAVFVSSFSVRGLISSFHRAPILLWPAKLLNHFFNYNHAPGFNLSPGQMALPLYLFIPISVRLQRMPLLWPKLFLRLAARGAGEISLACPFHPALRGD